MRRVMRGFGWLATALLLVATPVAVTAQSSAPAGPPAPKAAPYTPSPSDLSEQPVVASAPAQAPAAAAPGTTTMLKPVSNDPTQPRVRSVIVFGSDACPKATSADEIVVCSRQPDEDRYRIPPTLRTAQGVPVSNFKKDRGLLVQQEAGGAGGSIGSCSAVGPGGYIGCMQQDLNKWADPR
jgi:hypothetical protein